PDFFQGTETWTLTLVDPDNRQPVDLAARCESLNQLQAEMAQSLGISQGNDAVASWLSPSKGATGEQQFLHGLIEQRSDGRIKQFVTLISLRTRQECADLLSVGEYLPLAVTGTFAEHVVAFARQYEGQTAIVVVPRLTV